MSEHSVNRSTFSELFPPDTAFRAAPETRVKSSLIGKETDHESLELIQSSLEHPQYDASEWNKRIFRFLDLICTKLIQQAISGFQRTFSENLFFPFS